MGDRHTIAVSAAPTIEYWALLDHFFEAGNTGIFDNVQKLGLGTVAKTFLDPSLTTLIKETPLTKELNPGFWTASGVTRNKKLQDLVDKHVPLAMSVWEGKINDRVAKKQMSKREADKRIAILKRFKQIVRFALVDLTSDLKNPLFAGNTETRAGAAQDMATEQVYGASMVKIGAMVGAFQLLYDMNVLARQRKVALAPNDDASAQTAQDDLFRAAWEAWALTQPGAATPAKGASGPALEVQGRLVKANGKTIPLAYAPGTSGPWNWMGTENWTWNGAKTWKRKKDKKDILFVDGAPNLANILEVVPGNPLTVRFKQGNDPIADGFKMGEFGSPNGKPFYERLFAMVDASNNFSAGSCILDIGYLYIASALMQMGLFSIARGGGLFLAGTYTKKQWPTWIECPLPVAPGGPFQVATPAAVASLMTLLAQGNLVSPAASREMLFLLNKKKSALDSTFDDSGTYSPVYGGLQMNTRDADFVFSKIGIGDANELSDCALIERKVHGDKGDTTLRYVVSFVRLLPEEQFLNLVLTLAMDNAIQENAGLTV